MMTHLFMLSLASLGHGSSSVGHLRGSIHENTSAASLNMTLRERLPEEPPMPIDESIWMSQDILVDEELQDVPRMRADENVGMGLDTTHENQTQDEHRGVERSALFSWPFSWPWKPKITKAKKISPCSAIFNDRAGDDVGFHVIVGSSDVELDALCCNLCSRHPQCKFWVRHAGVGQKICFFKKNPGKCIYNAARRGGEPRGKFFDTKHDTQCRGQNPSDYGYPRLHNRIDTLSACQDKCQANPRCHGIQYRRGFCRVWITQIGSFKTSIGTRGDMCMRYRSSPGFSTLTCPMSRR